jgi:hypothetical protein
MKSRVVEGSQTIGLVDVRRILEVLRPMIEEGLREGPVSADDILNLVGDGQAGIVMSGKYDGEVGTGRVLIPLDFDRVISLFGGFMRIGEGGPGPEVFGSAPPEFE